MNISWRKNMKYKIQLKTNNIQNRKFKILKIFIKYIYLKRICIPILFSPPPPNMTPDNTFISQYRAIINYDYYKNSNKNSMTYRSLDPSDW